MHPRSVSLPARVLGHLDAVMLRAQAVVDAPVSRLRKPPKLFDAWSQAERAAALLQAEPAAPRWAIDGVEQLRAAIQSPASTVAEQRARAERILDLGDHLRGQLVVRMRSHPIRLDLDADQLARLGTAQPAERTVAEAGALQLQLLRDMADAADPAQVVRDHFETFVVRDPDDLSTGEWQHLHDLLTMPHTAQHLPTLPSPGTKYRPMTEVLGDLAAGRFRPQGGTRRMFVLLQEQLAGGPPDPAQAAIQLRELVMGSTARAKTGIEWARMQRLMELAPRQVRPPRGSYRGARPMRQLIRELTESDIAAGTGTTRQLDRWRNRLDPTYLARRERQLADGVRSGVLESGLGPDDVLPDAPFWQHLDVDPGVLESLQDRAQLLAWANEVPSTRVHTASVLDGIDARLGELAPTDDAMDALLQDARDLIEINRRRLDGRSMSDGAIRGYGRHPDYAEVGRLTQNVKLLARMAWPDLPGAPSPAASSTSVASEQARQAAEVLSW